MFVWLLNKSLLEAGTAGSRFRIPDTHSRLGEGTTPGQPGEPRQVAFALGTQGTGTAPGTKLAITCLLSDPGLRLGRFLGE